MSDWLDRLERDAPNLVGSFPPLEHARVLAPRGGGPGFSERAAERIAGHELEPCPLDHPLVGRLRCGEWLLFAGVHDLMHVEQTERLGPPRGGGSPRAPPPPPPPRGVGSAGRRPPPRPAAS